MISALHLRNFRAFKELDFNLGRITVILGPNNSGKSAIIAALTLLSQTLRSSDMGVSLLLNGQHEELGTYKDVIFGNNSKTQLKLGFSMNSRGENRVMGPGRRSFPLGRFEATFQYRPRLREIQMLECRLWSNEKELAFEMKNPTGRNKSCLALTEEGTMEHVPGESVMWLNFLPATRYGLLSQRKQPSTRRSPPPNIIVHEAWDLIRGLEYLGPLRDSPRRTYLFSGERPYSVGNRGEQAIDILVNDSAQRGKAHKGIVKNVSRWFSEAGIGKSVAIRPISDRHYEVKVAHPQTGESQNIADVGFGCSQILPVLVAGFNRPRDSLLVVEQPELHLHPRAQAELANFFCEIAKNGVQSVVETHSEHLILRLQSMVARGEIEPDAINIYYVWSPGEEKKVLQMHLKSDGTFRNPWPGGFFSEREHELRKLAKAREY